VTCATRVEAENVARFMAFRPRVGTVPVMIRLTRLRQTDPLYINPDHIERLEHHHQTVVRLLNGAEYVVEESPEQIVEQVIHLRARAIALAARLTADELDAPMQRHVTLAAGVAPVPEVHQEPDDEPSESAAPGNPEQDRS
jgi:uncharacterized protein YlzI (FlbEa/FlbD family)